MDKMRQEIEKKLRYWIRIDAMFVILVAFYVVNSFYPMKASSEFADFFSGFQLGICIGALLCATIKIVRYRQILKDEEAIRNCYIKEHDERNAAIWAKSGGTVIYTCGILMIGAAIIAGYFNPTVFTTLLLCGAFLLVLKQILVFYYCKTL